jgi:hypothetical protein
MRKKMNMKKLLVFFMVLAGVLFAANIVSAAELANGVTVEVNGIDVSGNNTSIVVGETIFVRVEFDALVNTQDVTVEVELEGNRKDVKAETSLFDVETGRRYTKTLVLEVPFDLKDSLSGDVSLNVEISGSGYKTTEDYTLRMQRESYSVDILSVEVPQKVNAGELFPVDIVLKNLGYNDLDDLFVTAKISALGVERTSFFGDLVALRCDDEAESAEENWGINITRKCFEDERDTVTGRIFLQMPYDAEPGVYALEVKVENDDTASSKAVQLVTKNSFPEGNFIASDGKLLIVNPTNEIVVYRLVPQSTGDVSVTLSETLVSVPAGSSKTVTVDAESDVTGTHAYSVSVFGMDGKLVETVNFTKTIDESPIASPIVALAIVLAIILVVLVVVLIVLLGKKPEKTEEFSESYY